MPVYYLVFSFKMDQIKMNEVKTRYTTLFLTLLGNKNKVTYLVFSVKQNVMVTQRGGTGCTTFEDEVYHVGQGWLHIDTTSKLGGQGKHGRCVVNIVFDTFTSPYFKR